MNIMRIGSSYNPTFSSIAPEKLKELEDKTTISEAMKENGKNSLHDIVDCWHNYDPSASMEWQNIDYRLLNDISIELRKLNIIHGGLYTPLGDDVLEAYGLVDHECR